MMTNVNCLGEPLLRESEIDHLVESGVIEHEDIADYLRRVPLPPAEYLFSYQQRQQQRFFFRNLVSYVDGTLPYLPVDLYQIKIIAILPEYGAKILRYIIETLFIIHGETKLNMICPLGGSAKERYGRPYHLDWCRGMSPSWISTATSSNQGNSDMMTTL